jgi:hypothetical protein
VRRRLQFYGRLINEADGDESLLEELDKLARCFFPGDLGTERPESVKRNLANERFAAAPTRKERRRR